jgi:hypothetical protein
MRIIFGAFVQPQGCGCLPLPRRFQQDLQRYAGPSAHDYRGGPPEIQRQAPLPCYGPRPRLPPWRSSRRLCHRAWATAGSGQEEAISTSCRPWLSSGNVAAGRLRITIGAQAQSSRDGVPSRTMSGMRWGCPMKLSFSIRVFIVRLQPTSETMRRFHPVHALQPQDCAIQVPNRLQAHQRQFRAAKPLALPPVLRTQPRPRAPDATGPTRSFSAMALRAPFPEALGTRQRATSS